MMIPEAPSDRRSVLVRERTELSELVKSSGANDAEKLGSKGTLFRHPCSIIEHVLATCQ